MATRGAGLSLVLMAAVFAGCIAADDGADPLPAVPEVDLDAFLSPILLDHDHSDPALHDLAWNMVRTGGRLLPAGDRGHAAPHALDVKGDLLFVSAWAPTLDGVAGLYIFDLAADPADPPLVGSWTTFGGGAGDRNMEATADGRFVVMSFEARDCAGNLNPVVPGMYLIDASDPTAPVQVDFVPVRDPSLGHHSITIYSSDAGDFVYHGAGDRQLYRIDRAAGKLVLVGEFMSGHDSAIFWDPLGERMLLLSADVSALTIQDLSDPAAPREVGAWPVPEPERYYVHTAVADHIGGRNIAVVNSEDFRDHPTRFWILDITDPAAIEVLADWTAPEAIASGPLTFSLHNPRIEDGILTFSFYHAGVWQFDLTDPERWSDPRPRAYYLPSGPVGRMGVPDAQPVMSLVCGVRLMTPDLRLDIPMDAVPLTFDVELYGEYVYAADLNTGVHVLRFDPSVGLLHPHA
jgi:hypothetical protein